MMIEQKKATSIQSLFSLISSCTCCDVGGKNPPFFCSVFLKRFESVAPACVTFPGCRATPLSERGVDQVVRWTSCSPSFSPGSSAPPQ